MKLFFTFVFYLFKKIYRKDWAYSYFWINNNTFYSST